MTDDSEENVLPINGAPPPAATPEPPPVAETLWEAIRQARALALELGLALHAIAISNGEDVEALTLGSYHCRAFVGITNELSKRTIRIAGAIDGVNVNNTEPPHG